MGVPERPCDVGRAGGPRFLWEGPATRAPSQDEGEKPRGRSRRRAIAELPLQFLLGVLDIVRVSCPPRGVRDGVGEHDLVAGGRGPAVQRRAAAQRQDVGSDNVVDWHPVPALADPPHGLVPHNHADGFHTLVTCMVDTG